MRFFEYDQNCTSLLKNECILKSLIRTRISIKISNLRLISNLSYISKLTEKAVFQQLNNHFSINKLYPKLHSAYRKYHSTETALLKVTNDILLNMNSQRVSLLVLLYLSAAFDTIDHSILLNRLKYNLAINGAALSWFESYLTNRKLYVSISTVQSQKNLL